MHISLQNTYSKKLASKFAWVDVVENFSYICCGIKMEQFTKTCSRTNRLGYIIQIVQDTPLRGITFYKI